MHQSIWCLELANILYQTNNRDSVLWRRAYFNSGCNALGYLTTLLADYSGKANGLDVAAVAAAAEWRSPMRMSCGSPTCRWQS